MNSVDIYVDGMTSNSNVNSRSSQTQSDSAVLKPFRDIFDSSLG